MYITARAVQFTARAALRTGTAESERVRRSDAYERFNQYDERVYDQSATGLLRQF